jgi:hypothetical protein
MLTMLTLEGAVYELRISTTPRRYPSGAHMERAAKIIVTAISAFSLELR